MNIDPQKDAEIRHLENGMEKAPKQGMKVAKKVVQTAITLVKELGVIIATKGKGAGKSAGKSMPNTKAAGISKSSFSGNKGNFPSKSNPVKQSLKGLVSNAVKTAEKANKQFVKPIVTEKTR